MKRANMISLTAVVVLATAMPASAGHKSGRSDAYFDYAKVISTEPIYRTVRIETPERECWDEPVTIYHPPGGYRSMTPMILGGIGGAAIGNQFGHGYGSEIGAIASGILGASVGRDIQHNYRMRQPGHATTHYETRCDVRSSWHEEQRLDGYRVEYRYNGRTYHTTMDHNPGDRVRVNVNVTPAE